MSFFEQPILNSPYRVPAEHWELAHTVTEFVNEMRSQVDA
jgi:hypothetical protein